MDKNYITYDEYVKMGGSLSEDAFNLMNRKATRMLDHITYDRIQYLDVIPDEVKEAMTDLIEQMSKSSTFSNSVSGSADDDKITQYSNGVESISYKRQTTAESTADLRNLVLTVLPDWLVFRQIVSVEAFRKMVPQQYIVNDDTNNSSST